jgi:hypothetical protein
LPRWKRDFMRWTLTLWPLKHSSGWKCHDSPDISNPLLPGYHGKGLYTGQGRLVYANNGENSPEARTRSDIPSGCLAEWDGTNWKVVCETNSRKYPARWN